MLEVGNGGMTADEYRVHMSMWSLLAAPLLAGNDLRTMSDETKSILMNTEVIAIDQDPEAKPVKKISETRRIWSSPRARSKIRPGPWAFSIAAMPRPR